MAIPANVYQVGFAKSYFWSLITMVPAAWLRRELLKYRPALTAITKEPVASGLLTPRESMIGNTITPIATTAPAPYAVVKIHATTIQSRTVVKEGLSPPSSTALRIMVRAMPVSMRTRPNQLPNMMLTAVGPKPSGPPWITVLLTVSQLTTPPIAPSADHSIAMQNRPSSMFPPLAA